jgi:hypothetical protein
MSIHSYEAMLVRPEGVGTWTYFNIPQDVSIAFGSKTQVRVKGTINGYPFQSTALPKGDGTHYLVVGKSIRDQLQVTHGDIVTVNIELDEKERQVILPEALIQAFVSCSLARDAFVKLSYSHKKEYVNWILGAKQEETRQRRIEKSIGLLSQGKKLRG